MTISLRPQLDTVVNDARTKIIHERTSRAMEILVGPVPLNQLPRNPLNKVRGRSLNGVEKIASRGSSRNSGMPLKSTWKVIAGVLNMDDATMLGNL